MSNKIELTIKKSILLGALSNVMCVVERKAPIELLSNIKLDAEGGKLTLTGADLDIVISESVNADITTNGTFAVIAGSFYDIIRKMPSDSITIRGDCDTGKVQIKTKGCRFSLPILSSSEFPIMTYDDDECEFDISAVDFLSIINKAKCAVSNDESRYYLTGVNLSTKDNMLISTSTNAHKLARITTTVNELYNFPNIIVPSKFIDVTAKSINNQIGAINIKASETKICITCDNVSIVSKLIDGRFPDVTGIFPSGDPDVLSVDRDILLKSIDRVSVASDGKTNRITMSIKENTLTISASGANGERGDEELEVISNINLDIDFNSVYLKELLSSIDSESIELQFYGDSKPMVISNLSNKNEKYLLMAMA